MCAQLTHAFMNSQLCVYSFAFGDDDEQGKAHVLMLHPDAHVEKKGMIPWENEDAPEANWYPLRG